MTNTKNAPSPYAVGMQELRRSGAAGTHPARKDRRAMTRRGRDQKAIRRSQEGN